MPDCAAGEREVCVGKDGDYADTVDTIDVRDDLYHVKTVPELS